MRKYLLFLCTISICLGCTKAEETAVPIATDVIKIPDNNFEKALIDLKIDTDNTVNGQISMADARKATLFNVSFKKIKDLTGIEGFTNLTQLMIGYNDLTAIDLSKNVALTRIVCHYNSLTDKLDLKNQSKLNSLDALGNPKLLTICVSSIETANTNANFQKDKTASFSRCE